MAALALLEAVAISGASAADRRARDGRVTRPPEVVLQNNARPAEAAVLDPHPTPRPRRVSAGALTGALERIESDLVFSAYPFSGCHDRAHLTWLALSRELGADAVAKVWVFGPRLMTVALDGAIETEVDASRWGVTRTRWDYHVAVVVETAAGLQVVDPALGGVRRVIPLDAWWSHFEIAPGSVYAILAGARYSFNTIGKAAWSGGRRPFNGGMFDYDRSAAEEQWLEKNLARDDVAVALAEAPGTCAPLQGMLREPQRLADALGSMSSGTPPEDCRGFTELFTQRIAHWNAQLQRLRGGE